MSTPAAYIGVVVIWATTPLAIQLSSQEFSYSAALALRMLIGLAFAVLVLWISGNKLVHRRADWWAFVAGGLTLFPNMILVYAAAQTIPSGLMSIIFGTFPIWVGLFSMPILGHSFLELPKLCAMVLAIIGLVLVKADHTALGENALVGMGLMLLATCLFALASVWLKRVGQGIGALRQTVGTLLTSTPFFILSWWIVDGRMPAHSAWLSFDMVLVIYLAVMGSVLGASLYFYILRHCKPINVSLVTLFAPVLALIIGVVFVNEKVTVLALAGCIIILLALGLYQGIYRVFWIQIANRVRNKD